MELQRARVRETMPMSLHDRQESDPVGGGGSQKEGPLVIQTAGAAGDVVGTSQTLRDLEADVAHSGILVCAPGIHE